VKTCFKCKRDLPYGEFYRHEMMADGHLGKCKDCTRDDVAENRIKNIGRIREYDRARAALPHRRRLRDQIMRRWRVLFPERHKAHEAVNNAVRDGRLQKKRECQRCGITPKRIEAHHADYSKPLDVEWLCKPCHAQADKERRAA
jgi:hypothetical protein